MDSTESDEHVGKPDTLQGILRAFGEGTSGHGWPKIVSTNNVYKKVFWLLISLGGLGVATWQITLLFIAYYKFPYTTKIEMRFEVQHFPAVTICNQNQFRLSQLGVAGPQFRTIISQSFMNNMKNKMFKPKGGAGPGGMQSGGGQQAPSSENGGATLPPNQDSVTSLQQQAPQPTTVSSNQLPPQHQQQQTTQSTNQNNPGPVLQQQTTLSANQQQQQQTQSLNQNAGPTTQQTQQGTQSLNQNVAQTTQQQQQATQSLNQNDRSTTQQQQQGTQSLNQNAAQTTQQQQQATKNAGATTQPPLNGGPPPGRKRRSLPRPKTETIDMGDKAIKPDLDLTDMTWFENTGERAPSSENARNLSILIANLTLEEKREMGHQLTDMIQECVYSGRTCSPENFTTFYSRDYGNCYTFNSGDINDIANISKPGPKYGLSLTLLVEQDEYVPSLSASAGMRILVHRQDTQPFPEEDGIDLSPGQKTSVSLRRVSVKRLPHPWGNCTNGTELTLFYSKNYSIPACTKSCIQNKTLEVCGCGDPSLPLKSGVTFCNTITELDCLDRVEDDYLLDKFKCPCWQSCWDDIYQKTISSSEWPSDSFKPTIMEQYAQRSHRLAKLLNNQEGPKKHLLKVEIFFEELSYTRLEEEPDYPPEKLLGDMGGQLGLWLGMSVITITEVLELAAYLLKAILCRRRTVGHKSKLVDAFNMPRTTQVERMTPVAWS